MRIFTFIKNPINLAALLFFSIISTLHADSRKLTTLPLKNQLPSQVIPVIRPLLSSGSTATEFNNQLILNVTDEELAKIQQLLGAIDQRPRQLMFTVRTPGSSTSNNRNININGSVGNNNVRVGTGNRMPGKEDRVRIGIDDSSSNTTNSGQQQVRAVEGMPAQISIGVTTPITSSYTTTDGRRVVNQEYYPVDQSVNVAARIIDHDRVILDINQQNNQIGNQQIIQRKNVPININSNQRDIYNQRDLYNGRERYNAPNIQTQSINTQVSGRVGEWIPLGGINQTSSTSSSGFSGGGSNSSSENRSVMIKVDILND